MTTNPALAIAKKRAQTQLLTTKQIFEARVTVLTKEGLSNPALAIARKRANTQLLVTKAVFRARESLFIEKGNL